MERQQGRTISDADIRRMLATQQGRDVSDKDRDFLRELIGVQQGRDISDKDLQFFNEINNPSVDNRGTFRTFLDNFSGNLQRESDRKLSENKALTEYVQSPEGQRASTAVGLGVASLLPIPGAKTRFANQMANIMKPIMSSGARVGRDVVGRAPMPMSKAPVPTNRGPRGPINIEQPTQGNLDLTKLKDTGITSLTNRMNPKMRDDLLGRRDRIQQDVIRMDGMRNAGEPVDMNRLFRLQDELDALNKTLK